MKHLWLALLVAGSASAATPDPVKLGDWLYTPVFEGISRTDTGRWARTAEYGTMAVQAYITTGGGKSATIIVSTTMTNTGGSPAPSFHGDEVLRFVASTGGPVQVPTPLGRYTKIRVEQAGASATSGATVWVASLLSQMAPSVTVIEIIGNITTVATMEQGQVSATLIGVEADVIMPVAPRPSATWTTVNGQGPATSATVFPAGGHQVPFSMSDTGNLAATETATPYLVTVGDGGGATVSIAAGTLYLVIELNRAASATNYVHISPDSMTSAANGSGAWLDQAAPYIAEPLSSAARTYYLAVPAGTAGSLRVHVRTGAR